MRHYSIIPKVISLGCAMLLCVLTAMAGETPFPSYYVYFIKGEAFLKKSGAKAARIKQKDLVFPGNTIEIKKEPAEIHLVDKDGNFLTLQKKGVYKVAELEKHPMEKTTGVTHKYLHLLWEELLHPESAAVLSEETLAGSWGGASRGGSDCEIMSYPFSGESISTDTLQFGWRHMAEVKKYSFILSDDHGNELISLILQDTSVTVVTAAMKGAERSRYFWVASPLGKDCGKPSRQSFYLSTPEEEQAMIRSITDSVVEEDKVLYNLKTADALAYKGFIRQARVYLSGVVK